MVRLADRSSGGWSTVNEYLPDELASDSDDDKRIRQAKSRALAKKKRNQNHQRKPGTKNYNQSKFGEQPSFVPLLQSCSVTQPPPAQPKLVLQPPQPFLSQGAFGAVGSYQQPQQLQQPQQHRYQVPLNVCFECGIAGHWKHNCPNKQGK